MNNLSEKIRKMMIAAPITTEDVAEELGITGSIACRYMWRLVQRGHAKKVGKIARNGNRSHILYGLTAWGLYRCNHPTKYPSQWANREN